MRSAGLDRARGLIMVLMVLDHARDFYFGFRIDPTDLDTTTPTLFFTRWVTHFCAPGFIFLAGASAYLYGHSRTPAERRRFLFTRGVWLVFLELTVVHFGWVPDPTYRFQMLQVIWAIGCSMVLLAPVSSLPVRVLVIAGALMVLTHNLLDGVHWHSFPWAVLHESQSFEPFEGHMVRVAYPLIPWVGVMALGFGLGALYVGDPARRAPRLFAMGVATTVGFVVLRLFNVYGDPTPWSTQRTPIYTLLSFLHCEKYPPSLAYLLMTLGPLLILLAAFERFTWPTFVVRPLEIYGRVPLFFYIAHLYLLRPIGIACAYFRWGSLEGVLEAVGSPEWPLYSAYLAWIAALIALLPICRAFGRLKERRRDLWWLSYL